MRRNIVVFSLCLTAIAVGFYLVPIQEIDRLTLLLIYLPIICSVSSAVYGLLVGVNFILPALCMVIFVPSIFIYYNYTAFLYVFIYYVVSAVSMIAGAFIRRLIIK